MIFPGIPALSAAAFLQLSFSFQLFFLAGRSALSCPGCSCTCRPVRDFLTEAFLLWYTGSGRSKGLIISVRRRSVVEIERKWMVDGWPDASLPLLFEQYMEQGYISVHPTVRIRLEATKGGETKYVLCFKSQGLLSRKEIEMDIPKDKYDDLKDLIGLPLIPKTRRTYALPDGYHLEVNEVDAGSPTQFMYAEVEFPSEEAAKAFDPAAVGLGRYLARDVTMQPGQSMGAYWITTRLGGVERPEDSGDTRS